MRVQDRRVTLRTRKGLDWTAKFGAIAKARYRDVAKMNFEAPLTTLVWLTSILSIALTYLVSAYMIPTLGGDDSLWWKLASIITCDGKWCRVSVGGFRGYIEQAQLWGAYKDEVIK